MEQQPLIVLTILFTALLLIVQRADPTKKQAVQGFAYFCGFLILIFVWWHGYWTESIVGFGIAVGIGILFWALIGRYNPVSSSEDIRVLGMDD